MALNPPIEALPIQETDRNGHLQRYLSGLPDFGSWQDQGEGPAVETNKTGMDAIQDREVEAADRRNGRKIRRREKAAILKPKPQPDPPEELDQEWWDNYRAQKQGLLLDKEVEVLQNRNLEMELEAERGEMIMEKKENRRLQQRIPKSKGRGKGKGIPGIEIIEAYKPMTTALGPRMTMKPETKKGMFANGKSSQPGVINLLDSTKGNNMRVSTSQSTPGRLTMESPETKGKNDWRDQWRRKSSQPHPQAQYQVRQINDKLPEQGYTNSTSWPSTLPSSDGPSKPSRYSIPGGSIAGRLPVSRSVRSPGQDLARYMYRHPSLPPLESRRSPPQVGPRDLNDPTYQYRSYPIPHNPSSHHTSPHVLDRHHHHHLQEPTSEEHRNIYLNKSTFPQDRRLYHTQDQVHQEHNPYSQAYSPLPPPHSHTHPFAPPHSHSHLYSHSLPFSSPYLHPNRHVHAHGNIPQTPILRDRRDLNIELGIPPPFSTPGPSRYPEQVQPLQPHFQTHQWDSFDHTALSERDDYLYQGRSNTDIPREEGLEGFWKGRRPVSNRAEHDHRIMGMDTDQTPILDQYDPRPSSYHGPPSFDHHGHLFVPEQNQHDTINAHWPHQHQQQSQHIHDPNHTFSPQVYQTPQIQHHQYNGSESRYQTPIPRSNYYQPDHPGPVLEDVREDDRGKDKEEEIMEFGASTDEWKVLWSSRKA